MEEFEEGIKKYAPYLNDLFRRITILTVCFIVSFILGIIFSVPILKILLHLFTFQAVSLNTTSPFQLFDLALNIGMFFAGLVCIPLAIYHLYAFLKTALHRHEKKIFFMLIPLSFGLFVLGFVYGFLILYSTIQVLANVNTSLGIANIWDISNFLTSIVFTSALLGLLFQFPIVISLIIKAGILRLQSLRNKRRHAYMGMFILTSLLPPTDGISLILMVLPLIVMYECTILYNKFTS